MRKILIFSLGVVLLLLSSCASSSVVLSNGDFLFPESKFVYFSDAMVEQFSNYSMGSVEDSWCFNGERTEGVTYVDLLGVKHLTYFTNLSSVSTPTKLFRSTNLSAVFTCSEKSIGHFHSHPTGQCWFSDNDYVVFGSYAKDRRDRIIGVYCGNGTFVVARWDLTVDNGTQFQNMKVEIVKTKGVDE